MRSTLLKWIILFENSLSILYVTMTLKNLLYLSFRRFLVTNRLIEFPTVHISLFVLYDKEGLLFSTITFYFTFRATGKKKIRLLISCNLMSPNFNWSSFIIIDDLPPVLINPAQMLKPAPSSIIFTKIDLMNSISALVWK